MRFPWETRRIDEWNTKANDGFRPIVDLRFAGLDGTKLLLNFETPEIAGGGAALAPAPPAAA